MDTTRKAIIWNQFGAAMDMLENAVRACPDDLWGDPSVKPEWKDNDVVGFWYVVYHTLFYLDFYLSDSAEGFAPPAPFTLGELDPTGVLPDRVYTKAELLSYLEHGRKKCHITLLALTDEKARQRCGFPERDMSVAELLLYTMRHVQHHAAQLHLLLRQHTGSAPGWVSKAKSQL